PSQIEQVLMRLAVNARDAMPEGGKLTVETRNMQLDARYASEQSAVEHGDYVAITVSDTGHGMDTATQARIFEPFFTTKKLGQGTGLGLAMVYGVVKQSGGHIWVSSGPNKGAKFEICLPRVNGAAEESVSEQAGVAPRGSETILLAEDEESLRDLICNYLRNLGYQVLPASNAAEARQIAQTHKRGIDLLVTDVVMPKGHGRELADDLRREFPKLKTIFVSGHIEDTSVRRGILESGSSFLQKPFSMKLLGENIREALDLATTCAAQD